MEASQVPSKFSVVWAALASSGYLRSIPISQPTPGNGQASFDLGFPPECFVQPGAGGYAPDGRDTNDILQQITEWLQWAQAGAPIQYDATFQSEIGGYPSGALVQSAVTPGLFWFSTVDNNTTNPDAAGAGWVQAWRVRLTAATNFYVNASTGSDGNNGLTSGTAWATLQHAWNVLTSQYDLNNQQVTINVTGSFGSGTTFYGTLVGQGDAPVIVNFASGSTISVGGSSAPILIAVNNALVMVQGGVTLTNSGTGGSCCEAQSGAVLTIGSGVIFGSAPNSNHIKAQVKGQILVDGNYSITGSAANHFDCTGPGSAIQAGGAALTISLSGTPNFSGAFAASDSLSYINFAASETTFSGSATGVRYSASLNALINTAGGGANFFPGNAAGSTSNGGIYT